jgi:hypothetical protein
MEVKWIKKNFKATYTLLIYVLFTQCSKGAEGDARFAHNTTIRPHIYTSRRCR